MDIEGRDGLYLVEGSPDVNGAVLYDHVNHFRDRSGEVRVGELGMEEDFRSKESLVANINFECLEGESGHMTLCIILLLTNNMED